MGEAPMVVREASGRAGSGDIGSAQANCEPGERATGGGAQVVLGAEKIELYEPGGIPVPSAEDETPTGWDVEWRNTSAAEDVLSVYVICAS